MDADIGMRGVEVLDIDVVWVIAIDRVSVIGAEFLRIEVLWASSDLLIRGEEDSNWVVFDCFIFD